MEAERIASVADVEYWQDETLYETSGTAALAAAPARVAAPGYPLSVAIAASAERKHTGQGVYARLGKRALDMVLGAALLVLTAPLVAILAATVLLTSGGPAFHRARRVGRNGEEFTMWKIRSMVPNAEQVVEDWRQNNPELAAAYFADYKLKDDPRVTRLGKFLRRSSLDELPQLWNVVRGEMSLVGPRPIVKDELSHYGINASDFLSVRPGITGMWQTDGRNDILYPERSWHELTYCRTYNLPMDLKILARTIVQPLRFNG